MSQKNINNDQNLPIYIQGGSFLVFLVFFYNPRLPGKKNQTLYQVPKGTLSEKILIPITSAHMSRKIRALGRVATHVVSTQNLSCPPEEL
jgi:hypothetical protein